MAILQRRKENSPGEAGLSWREIYHKKKSRRALRSAVFRLFVYVALCNFRGIGFLA
jgi:hypothetical protein